MQPSKRERTRGQKKNEPLCQHNPESCPSCILLMCVCVFVCACVCVTWHRERERAATGTNFPCGKSRMSPRQHAIRFCLVASRDDKKRAANNAHRYSLSFSHAIGRHYYYIKGEPASNISGLTCCVLSSPEKALCKHTRTGPCPIHIICYICYICYMQGDSEGVVAFECSLLLIQKKDFLSAALFLVCREGARDTHTHTLLAFEAHCHAVSRIVHCAKSSFRFFNKSMMKLYFEI